MTKEQTHDFRDGNGPVPSHIHTKGGGWVAGTANVHDSAYIGPDALVHGDARVKRGMYTSTPTSITRSDGYMFTLQSDGSIVAGCRDFTPDEAKAYWGNPEHYKHRESMAIVTALNAIAADRQ